MKKEQIFRLLNANKRPETFTHKPKEKTLEVILYKYTGLKIISKVKQVFTNMKEDLTVIFKPVKRFNKNDLKGVEEIKRMNPVINPSYIHTPENDTEVKKNKTHQSTHIKFIDEQKNESQFNPDEYFF